MTTILAFDTATEKVSAALAIDGAVVDEVRLDEANRHTERLISLIDNILGRAGLAAADVDAVAFGAGPGAFTGLRVACGVAQGLGWALGKPLIAASNLEATAWHAGELGFRGRLIAAHDARMHECYCAVFEVSDEGVAELSGAELVKPSMIAETARKSAAAGAAGSGFFVYADEIELPEGLVRLQAFETTARDIAAAAVAMFAAGKTVAAQAAAPLYVRNRVALTIKERQAGEKL